MSSAQTVFVVDDDAALCNSIKWLLESEGLTVETFHSARSFLEAYDAGRPGCLVLDVRMPGMSGLELQQELGRRGDQLPVIVISGHGDIPMAVQAVKEGAVDFIEKPLDDRALMTTVREALALDERRGNEAEELRDLRQRADTLTERERQVFERAAEGQPNKQIAAELDLSIKTIEVHRKHLMTKLGAISIAELVRAAMLLDRSGWSPGDDDPTRRDSSG